MNIQTSLNHLVNLLPRFERQVSHVSEYNKTYIRI